MHDYWKAYKLLAGLCEEFARELRMAQNRAYRTFLARSPMRLHVEMLPPRLMFSATSLDVESLRELAAADRAHTPAMTVGAGLGSSPQATDENTSLVFSSANGNAITVAGGSDQVELQATHGTVTLATKSGLTFQIGNGTSDATTKFSGSIAAMNAALNGLIFVPTTNFIGSGSIAVTSYNPGILGLGILASSSTSTVSINVMEVDQPPTLAVPAAQTAAENGVLVFSTSTGNAITVGDVDSDGANEQVTLTTTVGTMTLAGTSGIAFTTGTNGSASMTLTGTLTALNNALNGMSLSPGAGYTGTASIGVAIDDLGNTGVGGPLTASGSVSATFVTALTVTTTADVVDGDTSSINALLSDPGPDGVISLREAILASNNTPGLHEIAFDIPGGGVHTISLGSALPQISNSVFIDATTQPGYTTVPLIELNGLGTAVGTNGLLIGASNSTVRGLAICGFSGNGIDVPPVGADDITIEGNYIGINAAGTAIANGTGIVLQDSSDDLIGGTALAGNVISGNVDEGIYITGASSTGDSVAGNYIGTDPTGSFAIANGTDGVMVDGAQGDTIGLAVNGGGNLISGNIGDGVLIQQASSGIVLQNNYIGCTANGNYALPNGSDGISIADSHNNLIGGTIADALNAVTGNTGDGIAMDPASSGNVLEENIIGYNGGNGVTIDGSDNTVGGADTGNLIVLDGDSGILIQSTSGANTIQGNQIGGNSLGNLQNGITINGGDNTIGGANAGEGNVISGNTSDGVLITGSAATGNSIEGNDIGTDTTGSVSVANGGSGVELQAPDNTVGGVGAGNVIAFNTGDGVDVSASSQNTISQNSIYANQNFGIDLTGDVVAANTGVENSGLPNDGMNYPVILSASLSGGQVSVAGYVGSAPGQSAFANSTIEFFQSDTSTGTASGETYLGTLTADGAGNFSGALTVGSISGGDGITAAATDTSGNTSQFAANFVVTVPDLPPSVSVPAAQTAIESGSLIFSTANGNPISVADSDSDGAGEQVTLSTTTGTLTLASTTGITFGPGANGSASMTITGTLVDLDAALDGLSLAPAAGYASTATLSVGINDLGNSGTGGPLTASGSISIDFLSALTVTTAADAVDGNTSSINALLADPGTDGAISLREAILASNNTPGSHEIDFDIPGGGTQTITLNTSLPGITNPVIIDGTTQPGHSGAPLIGLDGQGAPFGTIGLSVETSNCTFRGLAVYGFSGNGIDVLPVGANNITVQGDYIGITQTGVANYNGDGVVLANSADDIIGGTTAAERNVISGNFYEGVHIFGSASTNDVVSGNYIGTNPAGTAAIANGGAGVFIDGASGNTIGVAMAGGGNVISGNTGYGIEVGGTSPSGNVIQGNFVGVNALGTGGMPNGNDGIYLDAATATSIGGTTSAARNIISGNNNSANSADGIWIAGGSANVVQGNYIGVDASGNAAMENYSDGILIQNSPDNQIGGALAGSGNVISGNGSYGLEIDGLSSTGNVVQGNMIGTNAGASAPLSNGNDEIFLSDTTGNTIGGVVSGDGNVIAGNNNFVSAGDAIFIDLGSANTIEGNFIGTNASGATGLGDNNYGVDVESSSNNVIGGAANGAGNVIAFNNKGVSVSGVGAIGNAIRGNSIYANAHIGIDLGDDGITPNTGTTNPSLRNDGMNFPVFTSVGLTGSTLTVSGYIGTAPGQSAFAGAQVDLFKSDASLANGQGQVYLGTLTVDGNGNFSGSLTVSGLTTGDQVTATATDHGGDTSEFAANATVDVFNQPPTITAPSGASLGENSLLQFSSDGGNPITIDDTDADGGIEQATLSVSGGTLTLGDATGVTFINGTVDGSNLLTFTGTLSGINAALNDLRFTPARNFSGTSALNITADDLGNTGAGGTQITNGSIPLTIVPVANTPSVSNASTGENVQTTSGLVITPNVLDGGAQGYYQITQIVGGMLYLNDGITPISDGQFISFSQGAAGLRFTPAADSVANGGFVVQAASSPTLANLVGIPVSASISIAPIVQTPVAHDPSVAGGSTSENVQTTAGLIITPNSLDGPGTTWFQITNIAGGTLFQHDGATPINNGDFISAAQGMAGLKFTPASNSTAPGGFSVQASTTDNASGLGGNVVSAAVTVTPGGGTHSGPTVGPPELPNVPATTVTTPVGPSAPPAAVTLPPAATETTSAATTTGIAAPDDQPEQSSPSAASSSSPTPQRVLSVPVSLASGAGNIVAPVIPREVATRSVDVEITAPSSAVRNDDLTLTAQDAITLSRGERLAMELTDPLANAQDRDHGIFALTNRIGQGVSGNGSGSIAANSQLWRDLDQMQDQMTSEHRMRAVAGAASLASIGVSVMYFMWAVRAGSVLSSLISSMPAWNLVDPLPILDQVAVMRRRKGGDGDEEDETLESMVDGAPAPV